MGRVRIAAVAGVYEIRNRITGDCYIGNSADVEKRWQAHINDLNAGRHVSRALQAAWDAYGADQFTFAVLAQVADLGLRAAQENRLIVERQPAYNSVLEPQAAARYVALARPPIIGKPYVECIGAPGESRADVEARALAQLAAFCAPAPHYGTVEIVAYTAAQRVYWRELARYHEAQEYERLRAAACAEGATR